MNANASPEFLSFIKGTVVPDLKIMNNENYLNVFAILSSYNPKSTLQDLYKIGYSQQMNIIKLRRILVVEC